MPTIVPDVILIRGAPGVGKSSASKRLRKLFAGGAIIEVDLLRGMIANVRWVDAAQHMVALDHARLLADAFLAKGYRPVIIVDTFSRGKLVEFTASLPWDYRVVSLYAAPSILAARINHRPDDQFKDLEASNTLNNEVQATRHPHEALIDTSELDPDSVASELHRILTEAA